jgi:hypothetical protein
MRELARELVKEARWLGGEIRRAVPRGISVVGQLIALAVSIPIVLVMAIGFAVIGCRPDDGGHGSE